MADRCRFRGGDRVRYCGPMPKYLARRPGGYEDLRSGGTVEWCQLGRLGANPQRFVVQVYWPKIERQANGWRGRGWVCRYAVENICRDDAPSALVPLRAEDV